MSPTILYFFLGLIAILAIFAGLYFHEKAKNKTLLREIGVREGLDKLKELEKLSDENKKAFDIAIAAYIAKYGDPSKRN